MTENNQVKYSQTGQGEHAPFSHFKGDLTDLEIPVHGDAFAASGCEFLTTAFRRFGSLSPDNRITAFETKVCPGGSTGHKLFLTVEYASPSPELHHHMFVKFSRDFTDQMRDDRGKYEMRDEVRLAFISADEAFPITVPKAYFADYRDTDQCGILITEAIGYSNPPIEPHHEKCMDHELPDPLEHYETIVTALARIAAAHKSGRLSSAVEEHFPFDRDAACHQLILSEDAESLRQKIDAFEKFTQDWPQLYRGNPPDGRLFEELHEFAPAIARSSPALAEYMHRDDRHIGLCHWNANIDNGWYWRDDTGALQCGLLDWGRVGQMNLALPLWGCLSGAPAFIWERHLDKLLSLFHSEFEEHGGPALDRDLFETHLKLYITIMGVGYFLDSPARILRKIPDLTGIKGPLDPGFLAVEHARNQLHISTNFLTIWRRHDIPATLRKMESDGVLKRD